MHEETIVFEAAGDIAALQASGALCGSVAGFAQPRGPDLMRRTEPLDAWCALRTRHGLGQYGGAAGPAMAAPAGESGDGAAFAGARGIDLASRDYLSLAAHPAVREAAAAAMAEAGPYGMSAAASRAGSSMALALEAALAALLRLEHVTLFPTGCGAAFGAITALVHGRDYVLIDALADAALRQGASAATRNVVPHRHLDTGHVRELLAAIRSRDTGNGILVATQGLFDMDAEAPDLPLMQHLCREYGATLLVDATHDLGALGPGGAGTAGAQAMLGKVDIVLGGFSSTFVAEGGFVASASRAVKRQLQLFAGPHLSPNALPPVQAACVLEALRIVQGPEGEALRAALLRNALALRGHLAETGMRCLGTPCGVVPLWIGSEQVACLAGRTLAREGVYVEAADFFGLPSGLPPGLPAGVPPAAARLRLAVKTGHRSCELRQGARAIGAAVAGAGAALGVEPERQPWSAERRRR